MFYDLPVLHLENIDDGVPVLTKESRVVGVKEHIVSIYKNALDFAARVRIVLRDPLYVVTKAIKTVRGKWGMLCVGFASIEADRRIDISLEQRFLIKGDNRLFICF